MIYSLAIIDIVIGDVIVTTSIAIKHKDHKHAAYGARDFRTESECDPAMDRHCNLFKVQAIATQTKAKISVVNVAVLYRFLDLLFVNLLASVVCLV